MAREDIRLPATAALFVWEGGRPSEPREHVLFDAHDAMIGLTDEQFRNAARRILDGSGDDYDILGIASQRADLWYRSHWTHGYEVTVEREDLERWLTRYGLCPERARDMDKEARSVLYETIDAAPCCRPGF